VSVWNTRNVAIIDGATNATRTVAAGANPHDVAVNPVTHKVYVANNHGASVTVLRPVAETDACVCAEFAAGTGTTTLLARPDLAGKGVNRLEPCCNVMMDVYTRPNTATLPLRAAAIIGGAGTDSISWAWNWESDSLFWGENLLCILPLEMDAATTNNAGLGSPFAGNMLVWPMYRTTTVGIAEPEKESGMASLMQVWPNPGPGRFALKYALARRGPVRLAVYSSDGRLARVLTEGTMAAGPGEVTWDGTDAQGRTVANGVYLVRLTAGSASTSRKVVLARP